MITNRIVTQGLSLNTKNLLVTRGFIPGFIQEVVEVNRRAVLRLGRSGKQLYDRCEEIVVHAKLVSVNKKEPIEPIGGWVRITYDTCRKIATSAVKTAYGPIKSQVDRILITIKRIK